MGYVPPPEAPRECFNSDKEWYEFNRAELLRAQEQMPNVKLWQVITIGLIILGLIIWRIITL